MTLRYAGAALVLALPLALASCADTGPAPANGGAASGTATSGAGSSAASTPGAADTTGGSVSPGATAPAGAPAPCPKADGSSPRTTKFSVEQAMCIDPAKTYQITMTTDAGPVVIDLDAKKAPKTVNNFVVLSRYHFYDGITFHRVIKDFMIQGGDPQGTGRGGPGYQFADELPQAGEYQIGSLAMANAGPNTNGSQFFIVTGQSGVQLPPNYSLFGKVSSGMEAVKKIEADSTGDQMGTPSVLHRIKTVTVAEK